MKHKALYVVLTILIGMTSVLFGQTQSPCLVFDGVNDMVEIANDSSLNISGEITIEAWIKKAANPTTNRGIVGKWWNYTGNLAKRSYDLLGGGGKLPIKIKQAYQFRQMELTMPASIILSMEVQL